MIRLTRQILLTVGAAILMPTCYAQWGVAAGAGVEQWNRQRELDIQQQQIDLQRQMQQLEIERYRHEEEAYRRQVAKREQERREYEDKRRLQVAEEEQRCREQKAIILEFDTSRGEEGYVVAKRAKQVAAEKGKNGCMPALPTSVFQETLERVHREIIQQKIVSFIESKKEYQAQKNADLFLDELDAVNTSASRGELSHVHSVDEKLALAHQRTIKRLAISKQRPAPKKNI